MELFFYFFSFHFFFSSLHTFCRDSRSPSFGSLLQPDSVMVVFIIVHSSQIALKSSILSWTIHTAISSNARRVSAEWNLTRWLAKSSTDWPLPQALIIIHMEHSASAFAHCLDAALASSCDVRLWYLCKNHIARTNNRAMGLQYSLANVSVCSMNASSFKNVSQTHRFIYWNAVWGCLSRLCLLSARLCVCLRRQ